jgi:hypothetical protein
VPIQPPLGITRYFHSWGSGGQNGSLLAALELRTGVNSGVRFFNPLPKGPWPTTGGSGGCKGEWEEGSRSGVRSRDLASIHQRLEATSDERADT